MTDRPILFSAPMVRALLAGRKTQTRRILKPQPRVFEIDERGTPCQVGCMHVDGEAVNRVWLGSERAGVLTSQKIRYAKGDRLWVRERWRVSSAQNDTKPCELPQDISVEYMGDDATAWVRLNGRPRTSMHMPRWASRLTLTVTDVRVQRLQDISEDDAIAEGLEWCVPGKWSVASNMPIIGSDPRKVYGELWDTINGPGSWESNPWIVAVTFDVTHGNIDAGPA